MNLRGFPVPEASILKWPRSVVRWFTEIHRAVTFNGHVGQDSFEITTDDATVTTVWTKEVPVNSVMILTVCAVAVQSDGTDFGAYRETTCFTRATGNVTCQSMSDAVNYESNASLALTAGNVTTSAKISVTGIAAEDWNWQGYVSYTVLRA